MAHRLVDLRIPTTPRELYHFGLSVVHASALEPALRAGPQGGLSAFCDMRLLATMLKIAESVVRSVLGLGWPATVLCRCDRAPMRNGVGRRLGTVREPATCMRGAAR